MKKEIKIPAMGESISEATVGIILKPTGSQVEVDDEILELETDKVNQVIYSPAAGILNLSVKPDEVVKIGQTIGYVDSEGKEQAAPATKKEEPKKNGEKKPEEKKTAAVEEKEKVSEEAPEAVKTGSARYARDAFLDELKAAPQEQPFQQQESSEKAVGFKLEAIEPTRLGVRQETRRKMTKIRKVIANRLVEAQHTTAMLTTFNEVDLTRVIEIRNKFKDEFQKDYGVKLGFMSFFVKAAVSAMASCPDLNSYIDGDEIVHREYYDIGIAVGTERGLIVPVVRDCDRLSFAEIEKSIDGYAKKAREGKITVDDLKGGGFTITNGGTYGSLLSTPILNPPQSGILGMHKIEKRPVVVNDQIVIRSMMYLAMSYDHRIVDGKEAVTFLVHIKDCLEDPARLLLKV